MKTCNQCNAPIFDMYIYCPNCGNKLNESISTNYSTSTINETTNSTKPINENINSTKITNPYHGKNEIIISYIFLILSFFIVLFGLSNTNTNIIITGFIIMIPSLVSLIIGKFKYWYHN